MRFRVTVRRIFRSTGLKLQSEAAAKAEEAAIHAAAERAEALKRLRLAHDAEMRKAGRDVLRLERQLRNCQRVSLLLLFLPLWSGDYAPLF